MLKLRRENGDLTALPHGGDAVAKFDEAKILILAELVAKHPDATLQELRELLRRRCRLTLSINAIWRALEEIKIILKSPAAPKRPA